MVAWVTRLAASRRFQAFAARVPGLRAISRAEGAAIFDVVQGFVRSQTLVALVELRLLHQLTHGPATAETLAPGCGVPVARLQILLQSGAAIGLLRRRRDGAFALTLRGASILGVPGLEAMIRHHRAFYADMADPVALLRGRGGDVLTRQHQRQVTHFRYGKRLDDMTDWCNGRARRAPLGWMRTEVAPQI